MLAARATCVLFALAFFVQAYKADSAPTEPKPEPVTTTSVPPVSNATTIPTTIPSNKTTPVPPTTTIPTTTTAPITTTPNATTTTVHPNTTTSAPPTTTPTTPTSPPTTPSTPTSTPPSTPTTTAVPPTTTPCPSDRHFDGPSFMGGIILTAGLVAIGFILWKFYKARTERNYHTL